MRFIDIAVKDLLQIGRDRAAAVFLIFMPAIFTLVFGFAFGGFGGDEDTDPRLPVAILDEDNGDLSQPLRILLAGSQVMRLVDDGEEAPATRQELEEAVEDEEVAAAIIVPTGYSQESIAGLVVPLILIAPAGSQAGNTVLGELQAATMRLTSGVQAANLSSDIYDREKGFADEQARQDYFTRVLGQAVAAWERPPVNVIASNSAMVDEPEEIVGGGENAFAQSSTGMMGQFAIAGLMGAASILVVERKSGALRRLLTTNISRSGILAGHFLAMAVMILTQLLVLALFGQLLLRLDYFGSPLATLLIIVTTSLFGASLGLLIGALARREEHVVVYALVLMFILAGLGGAWVPLEVMPAGAQAVAKVTPLTWTVTGFQDIIVRGHGVADVAPAGAVLIGYAVVIFALAAWRFRFE